NQLRYVAEIETHSAAIGAAVFADLVPADIGLVGEAPRPHDRETLGQERVGTPKIQMRRGRREFVDWQRHDLVECHRSISRQTLVLRGHLSSAIGKPPRWIGKNGGEATAVRKAQSVVGGCR